MSSSRIKSYDVGMFHHFCHWLKTASGTMFSPWRHSVLLQPERKPQDIVSGVNNAQPLVGSFGL